MKTMRPSGETDSEWRSDHSSGGSANTATMVSASSASNFGMVLHPLCLSDCANTCFSDQILPALCAVHTVRTAFPSTASNHGTLHITCSVCLCLHLVILVLSQHIAPVMGELDVQLLGGPINASKGHSSWITSLFITITRSIKLSSEVSTRL